MSTTKLQAKPVARRIRKISRTESEGSDRGGGEDGRLTEDDVSPGEDADGLSYCEVHDIPPPPDGGYGWVIVIASFMCNMIVDGIAYTFGVFLGEFVNYYGEGKGKIAWVGSLLSGMYLSAGPLVSALTNKFGCRTVCISGSIIGCAAFVLSTFSPDVNMLMITYGIMGGIGFGLIYLPAVVCVGYYFETKRSLATGIAVCGSGFGTFAFAPFATLLLEYYDWKGANLILAGLILNCAVFGALMRPLEFPKDSPSCKPLLQRMADEKRFQMERGSIGGSYFIVQLPDGSMEKRMKMPINIDPGVHSSFNLNELVPGTPITPVPTMAVLPTITEAKIPEQSGSSGSSSSGSATELKIKDHSNSGEKEELKKLETSKTSLPRNASQPAFSTQVQGLPKNGSVPFFDRLRKPSTGERFKPTLQAIKVSRPNISSNGDVRRSMHLRLSNASIVSGTTNKNNNADDMWSKTDIDVESVCFATSKVSMSARKELVRPLSRKDIFYSGSVVNLPEYQSQRSIVGYRQSVVSLPKYHRGPDGEVIEPPDLCPCCTLPESFKSALATMLDFSLLKNPVFLLIGISNVFGMAGLYIPFVYLVDYAVEEGIERSTASMLLSIIGITNTIGRVACGWIADFPSVNSLFLNNMSLVVATIAVSATPLCKSFTAYVIMAIFFGLAISAYISLTSIILVDLLGLDKLTNAFGLLILFRGAAAIFGSPLAGMIYDATKSYSIPFYMAGFLFLLSTISSFMAPCMKSCVPADDGPPVLLDALTPIDEDDEEGEDDIPEIIETAPSPGPTSSSLEIKQIESVL
ncbi:monocarboxylate transporter 9 isoform X4 [Halyomorpha halys]|uniref:monocarboxylate transporter 9 isoform X4 n=1 Tax=Halyomorpha halys TaxID=286706 RepID=UPI0006D4DFEB|nr:monocarboxylate transporter 9 isoform X4 [Halyomorpha halys]